MYLSWRWGGLMTVLNILIAHDLVLPLGGRVYLGIKEDQFPLQFLPLCNQIRQFFLIILTLGAKEDIRLNKLMPFPFKFLLPLQHLILNFLLISSTLQLIKFLLSINQFLFILF